MVDKDGTARIAGLGNASILHSTAGTVKGGTSSDRLYRGRAPELACPGMFSDLPESIHPTKASDMFAFGVMAWEVWAETLV